MDEPRASLSLWDYRRRVADLYAAVRNREDAVAAWDMWRTRRDRLFASHPQSAIPAYLRHRFPGLAYFPYDPDLRIVAEVSTAPERHLTLPHSGSGSTPGRAFGLARFEANGELLELTLYWLEEYGGGVFLPFRDTTNGSDTYGGGRYLLDTAKGADLGWVGESVLLDFNFAYHPSCVHDPRWSCPLSPPENQLATEIRAGERL